MLNILIPEDIPSSNKGEAALLNGIIESLKPMGSFEVSLFSLNPEEDRLSYRNQAKVIDSSGLTPRHMLDRSGSRCRKVSNYSIFWIKHLGFMALYLILGNRLTVIFRREAWKAYMDADLVLLSHDNCYAPLYHGLLTVLFRLLRKPVMIYGATIMPRYSSQNKVLRKVKDHLNTFVLSRAGLITLREEHSLSYLRHLSLREKDTPVRCYPDLAFLLSPVDDEEVDRILRQEGIPQDKPIIGMAISQRMLDLAYPDRSHHERIEQSLNAIVNVVDYITGELGADVVFMPHSIGPSNILDDRIPADWCRARALHKDKIFIIRNNYDAPQLKGLASRLYMTIGTRLHFTIDAVSQGVPSLLITYKDDIRCHGIIGGMLGLEDFLYDIEQIESESLITMVQRLWDRRDIIRDELSARIPELKDQTYQHGHRAFDLWKEHAQR